MKSINIEQLKDEIQKGAVFVMYTTTWCPDCKMMKPVIKELEQENKHVSFFEIDAEENEVFRKGNILKVPSFILHKDGKEKHLGYEYVPKEILEKDL